MQDAGVDDVARWLVERAELPQYEPAFRENKVDGPMLLDIVARDMLPHLVENPLHQCRLRSQLATFERRASSADGAPVVAGGGEGEGAHGADAPGACVSVQGTRRRTAEAALPGDERPRQRLRHGEPQAGVAAAAAAAAAPSAPLVAVDSPAHGVLVYARPPLADLEVRAAAPSLAAWP